MTLMLLQELLHKYSITCSSPLNSKTPFNKLYHIEIYNVKCIFYIFLYFYFLFYF